MHFFTLKCPTVHCVPYKRTQGVIGYDSRTYIFGSVIMLKQHLLVPFLFILTLFLGKSYAQRNFVLSFLDGFGPGPGPGNIEIVSVKPSEPKQVLENVEEAVNFTYTSGIGDTVMFTGNVLYGVPTGEGNKSAVCLLFRSSFFRYLHFNIFRNWLWIK